MSRNRTLPKTADTILPRSLTESFASGLESILTQDGSGTALYLRDTFLSKFVEADSKSALDRRSKAIAKWLSTEDRNKLTNSRFISWGQSPSVMVLPGISAKKFLDKVELIVSGILPWTPSIDIANGGFSGGASTSKGRRHSHPAVKFLDQADVTRPALSLFNDVNRQTRWADHIGDTGLDPRIVEGNVMFTVPKNSDIDRCAAKEPDLNMFLQKGFGNQIRTLLKKTGINLNDQNRNKELARIGSVDGSLMTLDLSSASDSVTTELVRRVMPFDWFHYLDLVRSRYTEIDGVSHCNEMFSSMGNGFTFELESLLFYAIARATAYFGEWKGSISVYGDDIIAPSGMYDDLVSALDFCGFKTNPDKSFWEGPFRESCGAHWHHGLNINPFYIKGPFKTISDLILTLNQLTNWCSRDIGVVDPRYEDFLRLYFEYVPESLWGGSDLTSRTSLVTGHAPRSELVYPVEDRSLHHVGGLLLWLFQVVERQSEGCLFVSRVTSPSFARVRRRKWVDRLQGLAEHNVPLFLGLYPESASNVEAIV